MSSVLLPCPSCSAPLILDEENAGSEVICPGCGVRLLMPSTVSSEAALTVLPESPPGETIEGTTLSAEAEAAAHAAKAALPKSRAKSAEEERKRLAGAAAAAGAAHSFKPEEVSLPVDHRRIILPSKRTVPVPAPAADAGPPVTAAPPAGSLPTARKAASMEDAPAPEAPGKWHRGPNFDGSSAVPARGASRLPGPGNEVAEAPPARATPAADSAPFEEEGAEGGDAGKNQAVRGGFRLGASRELHFSPMHASNGDAETADWGAKNETAVEAARARRFVSLAILVAILAAGGVGYYMLRQAFSQPEQTASLTDDGAEEAAANGPLAENVMRNVEDARRVLKRFLDADSIEKMAAEVRHPEVTRPRMERHYGVSPLKPRKIRTESQSWSEIRIGDTEFIRVGLELDDFVVYPITLELIPGAEPKVDWESSLSWAEIPWKEFLRKPPEQSVDYRVTVTLDPRDQYYNYSFKGRELDLLCFKLEDPSKYGSCWAYCDKDSEAASNLLFNLKRSRQQGIVNEEGKTAISCILRLRFPPEGMKTNQVMIEQFLHDTWVEP